MKVYLVGGAVRDELLRRQVHENDWVVIGETPDSMLAAGFQQVGKDFPVFLHPQTKEEYALARTERKVDRGYHGFIFNTAQSVTLEEDLMRRDLTINAIAKDSEGHLIDPYGGVHDLEHKILRHVSPAFVEDPVRILRVARFSARFPEFRIAEETLHLMREMVSSGEVNALVPERVWKETEKAMSEVNPTKFIHVLEVCGALKILFPFLSNYQHYEQLLTMTTDSTERIILLLHSAGSVKDNQRWYEYYRLPQAIVEMLQLLELNLACYKNALKLCPEELLTFFKKIDIFRREKRFKKWLRLCHLLQLSEGNTTNPDVYFLECYHAIKQIEVPHSVRTKNGEIIAQYIEDQRLSRLKARCRKNGS